MIFYFNILFIFHSSLIFFLFLIFWNSINKYSSLIDITMLLLSLLNSSKFIFNCFSQSFLTLSSIFCFSVILLNSFDCILCFYLSWNCFTGLKSIAEASILIKAIITWSEKKSIWISKQIQAWYLLLCIYFTHIHLCSLKLLKQDY